MGIIETRQVHTGIGFRNHYGNNRYDFCLLLPAKENVIVGGTEGDVRVMSHPDHSVITTLKIGYQDVINMVVHGYACPSNLVKPGRVVVDIFFDNNGDFDYYETVRDYNNVFDDDQVLNGVLDTFE